MGFMEAEDGVNGDYTWMREYSFEATTVDDIALFDAQQKCMFDVFMSTLKTHRGEHYVRKYAATKDAQSVWGITPTT